MEERNSVVVEEYLQVIYQLQSEGNPVKAVNIAARIQATPSTVHATLSRMQRDQLIDIDKKKHIRFTEDGEEQAKDMIFRHNLAEYFLCNTLGIPWYEVHRHAHKLEHSMTPLVVEKLAEFLGYPEYCPHGVPMHGYEAELHDTWFALDQANEGSCVRIVMIDESLEDSEDLLKHLHKKSIIPGQEHKVMERLDATRSLILDSEKGQTMLPFDIAQKIKVTECC